MHSNISVYVWGFGVLWWGAHVVCGLCKVWTGRGVRGCGAKLPSCTFSIQMLFVEVSLVFWTGVFLSPGRRIRVTGKETGPGPGGYG